MKRYKISFENKIFDFESDKSYSLLALCKRNKISIPHSCFEGRCGLCKAKIINGQVQENITSGLNSVQRKEGFILTCQSTSITCDLEIQIEN